MTEDNAKDLAYQLYKENVRSVNNRYQETNTDEDYDFEFIAGAKMSYSVEEIAGAIDCLEYQSCEREDYHESDAWQTVCSMRKQLLRSLAQRKLGNETTWEINEVKGKNIVRVV